MNRNNFMAEKINYAGSVEQPEYMYMTWLRVLRRWVILQRTSRAVLGDVNAMSTVPKRSQPHEEVLPEDAPSTIPQAAGRFTPEG